MRLLEKVFAETALGSGRRTISPGSVWQVFSRQAGLPHGILDEQQPMGLDRAKSSVTSTTARQNSRAALELERHVEDA